jgi:antitoxin component of MazEF toxin-antitoxin module
MRELVKLRVVAGSVVISLPHSVLEPVGLKSGDRVLVEAAPPRRLVITKEGRLMSPTQRVELEIEVLERHKAAIESDLAYKSRQYSSSMPCEDGMGDNEVAMLIMLSLDRDRDRVDADLAEKKLQLYDLQGGETKDEAPSTAAPESEENLKVPDTNSSQTHAERIFWAAAHLTRMHRSNRFSRNAVRKHLGLDPQEWQSGYTAIFQAMRDDHPGGAPKIADAFRGVFHQVSTGTYELTVKGQQAVSERGKAATTERLKTGQSR